MVESIWHWAWRIAPVAAVFLVAWLALLYCTRMPGHSYRGALPLLSEQEHVLREELSMHVEALAGRIGERNLLRYDALEAAAEYIRGEFAAMGYGVREQPFAAFGKTVKNLEAELPGAARPEEIVLFGAHYDSVAGAPGANDNASGVAALLALARQARGERFARTLRFVAFVNEEPPYFQSGQMGSRVYAQEAARRGDRIVAMLSLETMGYYVDAPGSQFYPFPLRFFYPDRGNFIGVVGNLGSRDLVREVVAEFRRHAQFPSEGAAAPAAIPGVGWSDHWSFWQEGYAAVMVTDTALYRYPQYHTPADTPEIVNADRLARVVTSLAHVMRKLAQGGKPVD